MLVVFSVKSKIELLFHLSSDPAKVDCSDIKKRKERTIVAALSNRWLIMWR